MFSTFKGQVSLVESNHLSWFLGYPPPRFPSGGIRAQLLYLLQVID